MEKLSALKEKTKAKVIEILGDTHFQSRIISIGITVGSEIEVIKNSRCLCIAETPRLQSIKKRLIRL